MLSRRSKLSSQSVTSTSSRRSSFALPAALLAASGLALFAAGCGGGSGYVVAVGPPYGCINCGYGYGGYGYGGYGYGAISTSPAIGSKSVPGASTSGTTSQPAALAVDASGNLYIADRATSTIREAIATSGTFSPAISVGPALQKPAAIAIDPSGDLYVLDQTSGTVRRVSKSTGTVALVAGSHAGFAGDHGAATSAQLNQPSAIAFDQSGNLFIADTGNNRIREVAADTGTITTVAGTGTAGFSGDGGAAFSAQLNQPRGITVTPDGNLFIADTGNQSIREVPASSGTIFTVAGNHAQGYSGDGAASYKAELSTPYATAFDPNTGNMYVADLGNGVVRVVLPNPAPSN